MGRKERRRERGGGEKEMGRYLASHASKGVKCEGATLVCEPSEELLWEDGGEGRRRKVLKNPIELKGW